MSCPIEAMAIRGFESHCSENIGQSAGSSVDPIHTGEYKVFIGDRSALTSMSFDKTPAVYTPVLRDSPLTWKRKPSAYMSILGFPFPGLGPRAYKHGTGQPWRKTQCLVLESPVPRSVESFAQALEADSSYHMMPPACRRKRATGQYGKWGGVTG